HHPATVAAGQRRLAAATAYADVGLALGRAEEVVSRLGTLVAEEPMHEALHARLMLALAGAGRQAAAIDLFSRLRDRLTAEVGLERGPELQAAHLRVLRRDVSHPTGSVRPGRTAPAPAQLPADVSSFAGRDGYLRELTALLHDPATGPGTAVRIVAIIGMAGVGKTALAVRWAHRVAPRFDGQLYVNLR